MLQHVRPKYACPACQAHVVIAERLPEPIEKGLPGPGLMAHVAVSKYADHLPLYRQEGIFKRFGVELSRSTMCDWMAVAAELLAPIVQAMLERDPHVRGRPDRRHAGESAGPRRQGDQDRPALGLTSATTTILTSFIVYTPDHSGAGPQRDLQGLRGLSPGRRLFGLRRLFVIGQIIEVGCWMHARRKFYEARTSDPVRSHLVLAWVDCSTTSRTTPRRSEKTPEYDAFVAHGMSCEASDRVRSSTRSMPGWWPSGRRCCRRARSARRSSMR